jgi:F-type H+-transporting ATPase subunit b
VKISTIKRLLPALVVAALLFAPVRLARSQEASPAATTGAQESTAEGQSSQANKQEVDENDEYLHSPVVRALGAKLGMNAEQAATAFTVANFLVLAVLVGCWSGSCRRPSAIAIPLSSDTW